MSLKVVVVTSGVVVGVTLGVLRNEVVVDGVRVTVEVVVGSVLVVVVLNVVVVSQGEFVGHSSQSRHFLQRFSGGHSLFFSQTSRLQFSLMSQ